MVQIIKRDGTLEDFDANKIAKVAEAAGLEHELAEKLTATINEWIQNQEAPQISSHDIREKVVVLMKEMNEVAANAYTWYENVKDAHTKS